MSTPKVSVIMPSLNVAPYIRECIESAVNQTLRDIEIICVDAGSTDGTWEILQEYAQKDDRVRLIHSDMKSYGRQMNLGYEAASGEYFAILETDDYILPTMYEELYNTAVANRLDVIQSDHRTFTGDGEARTFVYKNRCIAAYYNKVLRPGKNQDVFNSVLHTWCGLYRMDFLREHNIRHNETPGASYQDNGFWFQVFMFAQRLQFVNKAYYQLRRDNPNSSVKSKGKVFCIFDEYAFIEEIIRRDPELVSGFISIFQKKKFDNCIYHYGRIAEEFRADFLERMSREFGQARSAGELDRSLFDAKLFQDLQLIIDQPEIYRAVSTKDDKAAPCADRQVFALQYELKCAQDELEAMRSSASYRIGRGITFPARMLANVGQCYRETGFKNTVKRILVFAHLMKDDQEEEVCRNEQFWAKLPEEQYGREVTAWFKVQTGRDLNLENPTTFTDKLMWLNLYGRTPLWSFCACKYECKPFVRDRIGEKFLIPMLGVWDNANDIDFDALPDKFVLKATHGCKWNIVVTDKSSLNITDTRVRLNYWLSKTYAYSNGVQKHYDAIVPRIIAEEYLENRDGFLCDYKVWCFNGKAKFVQFIAERQNGTKMVFFDREWNRQSFISNDMRYEEEVPKPDNLEELLWAAEQLAEPFPYARVDFYVLNDGSLKFGEITLTPAGGTLRFDPVEYDQILGDMLDISAVRQQ